ncbi:MAG: DUF3791 domain-containing protein [Bacilli bacterium]|nr:DUF3791 domain-containing protein [Bacilli bacterium]
MSERKINDRSFLLKAEKREKALNEGSLIRGKSRVNMVLDKEINRFIVMCVEQYASFAEKSSREVFRDLDENGVIKELSDDYEDMHGMSADAINEYIGKRLSEGTK